MHNLKGQELCEIGFHALFHNYGNSSREVASHKVCAPYNFFAFCCNRGYSLVSNFLGIKRSSES